MATSTKNVMEIDSAVGSIVFDAVKISNFPHLLPFIQFKEAVEYLAIEDSLDLNALLEALNKSGTKSIRKLHIHSKDYVNMPGFATFLQSYAPSLEEITLDSPGRTSLLASSETKSDPRKDTLFGETFARVKSESKSAPQKDPLGKYWRLFRNALALAKKLKILVLNLHDYVSSETNYEAVTEAQFLTSIVSDLPAIEQIKIHPNSCGVHEENDTYQELKILERIVSEKRIHFRLEASTSVYVARLPMLFQQDLNPPESAIAASFENSNNYVLVQAAEATEEQLEASRSFNEKLLAPQNAFWNIEDLWTHTKTKGQGIRIALLDSGVDVSHPLLVGAIKGVKSFLPNEIASVDYYGHGTHCAGILVGRLKSGAPLGVAPDAELLVGKVIDQHGRGEVEWLVDGIKWAIEHKANVISLSLGTATPNHALMSIINEAVNKRIIIVTSAANYGSRDSYNIGYPARFGNILCVGSHTRNGQPSEFTSTGREVDFLAPGERVWSAAPGNKWRQATGTSISAPFVAGLAALLLNYGRVNRKNCENVAQMRELLRTLCTKSGHHDQQSGYGVLNPKKLFSNLVPIEVWPQFDPTEDDEPISLPVTDPTPFHEPDARLEPHTVLSK